MTLDCGNPRALLNLTGGAVGHVHSVVPNTVMEFGGHLTDLMYSHPRDPEGVREARVVEGQEIETWIHEWTMTKSYDDFDEL